MTTPIHNADQSWYQYSQYNWVLRGLLRPQEMHQLCIASNTKFYFYDGLFIGDSKAPNTAVRERSALLPGVVFEAGWSQPLRDLREVMQTWIVKGNGHVRAVILINWAQREHQVEGDVEVWVLGRDGMPRLRESHQVYPAPANAAHQVINLTRGMIFGRAIEPNRRPGDIFELRIDDLRIAARSEMELMGYQPAQG